MIIDVALILAAYLLGSISSAIIVCKLMGLPDPRELGSGNPGATNVLRIGGKKPAAITLAGDMLKGLLPLLAGHLLDVSLLVLALTGLSAFLGHLYPVFFRFQGGKGVATAFGVAAALAWQVALAMGAVWLAVAAASRWQVRTDGRIPARRNGSGTSSPSLPFGGGNFRVAMVSEPGLFDEKVQTCAGEILNAARMCKTGGVRPPRSPAGSEV